ncbi:MAG TPA: hypothetical protein VMV31_02080 [Terriglobales bacterium]|nr:hypothetical protein [Terriglobales bacterium]HVA64119.1 hypothetical protein [Terriglobales bacterium]
MRMLMKVKIPTDQGNRLVREGKLGALLRSMIEELKPEAVYFYEDHGQRTGLLVADLAEPSQIPRVAEPFFLALHAEVEMHPAMTPQDLAKAEADLQRAAQKYPA